MSARDVTAALAALVRVLDHADSLDVVRRGAVLEHARNVLRRSQAGQPGPLPWTAFAATGALTPTTAQVDLAASLTGLPPDAARALVHEQLADTRLLVNSRYQVAVRPVDGLVHVSVKRIDQEPVHDWRDLQRIKDEVVGPDCEAVELYPARARLVDTANQYHLWCSPDPTFRFPLGFREGLTRAASGGGAHQRPPAAGA